MNTNNPTIQTHELPTRKRKIDIHTAIFIYWAILVIWQNIGEYTSRTSIDLVIKTGLILWLVFWYFYRVHNTTVNSTNLLFYILFVIIQMITFITEPKLDFNILISYIFPSLFIFLSFVYSHKYKITKRQYLNFLNCVIIIVAYASLYAVFFKTDQFLSVFLLTSSYGNELTSFFFSNHEYGMYLVGGIIACIVCLESKKKESFSKKLIYWLCLVLFSVNLILTFSRTSLLGLAGFILVYVFFMGRSTTKKIIILCMLAIAFALLLSEELRNFTLTIVLKNNYLTDRVGLYDSAMNFFKEGTSWQKIFGWGIYKTNYLFARYTSHGSAHNAYMQVLLNYGIIGLAFMICFMLNRFLSAIKLMKKDKFSGVLCLALMLTCTLLMTTNTAIIFNSPIDSFFLTAFTIVIPKYLENTQ